MKTCSVGICQNSGSGPSSVRLFLLSVFGPKAFGFRPKQFIGSGEKVGETGG